MTKMNLYRRAACLLLALLALAALAGCGGGGSTASNSSTGSGSGAGQGGDAADFVYSYNAQAGGVEISGYSGTSIKVSIPDAIEGEPVVCIRRLDAGGIKELHIPDSVTVIADGALRSCVNLTSITYQGKTYDGLAAFDEATGFDASGQAPPDAGDEPASAPGSSPSDVTEPPPPADIQPVDLWRQLDGFWVSEEYGDGYFMFFGYNYEGSLVMYEGWFYSEGTEGSIPIGVTEQARGVYEVQFWIPSNLDGDGYYDYHDDIYFSATIDASAIAGGVIRYTSHNSGRTLPLEYYAATLDEALEIYSAYMGW